MRYLILASDYDGTLAHHDVVNDTTIEKIKQIKISNRKIALITGREMADLERVFPQYKVFDYIVAENGALIYNTATGTEELLGPAPDAAFVDELKKRGVAPISVGKVIIATWEPHQIVALEVIKEFGYERQIIFNKGAVMILPPGINKASGLQALLQRLCLSEHNSVAVGDAENDSAMFKVAECAVAVNNALPSLKKTVDLVTNGSQGDGVVELIDKLIADDLEELTVTLTRHFLQVGTRPNNEPFLINPYRSGILLSGVSGGGKSTFTVAVTEALCKSNYQFCLIDPEGDYVEMQNAVVVGKGDTLPTVDELCGLLKNPKQNVVISLLSVPMEDRPPFFTKLLAAIVDVQKQYGHPHWLLVDEAHHMMPPAVDSSLFTNLKNFMLISYAPDEMCSDVIKQVGMVITIGDNAAYPIEQFCKVQKMLPPKNIPTLKKGEACVYDLEAKNKTPFVITVNEPEQMQHRHKRKYATGDMGDNSFVFTGKKDQFKLKANNLVLFAHIAEGIDDATWNFHLHNSDFTQWFRQKLHDEELADISEKAEKEHSTEESKKQILAYINQKYTT
ncbi:MAG: Cof-type HAD-IIB family hydrolase [Bacteroidota bacterium]|nr:Cof-type HAD-IIB family hydrolase [Bacteroidota bacterium]